jgi:hypothetical protein
MKHERLTARVSPSLHHLALQFGSQSAALRAAILITAASLDYDMQPYADDVRAVLADELAPGLQSVLRDIYLKVCTPAVRQSAPPRQPRDEQHPAPSATPPAASPLPQEPEQGEELSRPAHDPLVEVGIAV